MLRFPIAFRRRCVLAACLAVLVADAAGQLAPTPPSPSSWLPAFGADPTLGSVNALLKWDGGGGPALYFTGSMSLAGGVGVHNIARWDGKTWSSLAGGIGGTGQCLAVFDDGAGPALFAGGFFTPISRWNGTSWTVLNLPVSSVDALTVWDDGSGPALYAGGIFTWSTTPQPAKCIGKWNGSVASPLGSGIDKEVKALAVWNDGTGSRLCAGGYFTLAGGQPASGVAVWNGSSWSALGSGVTVSQFVGVKSLAAFDDGSGAGAQLYAGGNFATAGSVAAKGFAKWNGSSWSLVGNGEVTYASDLRVIDDGAGGGPALFVTGNYTPFGGGDSTSGIFKWNGSTFSPLQGGANGVLGYGSCELFDDGSGAGPQMVASHCTGAEGAAQWNGTSWSPLETGFDGPIHSLLVFDDGGGGGPQLYAGGQYLLAHDTWSSSIASWNGSTWSSPGGGLFNKDPVDVVALASDGSASGGPVLYAAENSWAPDVVQWQASAWANTGDSWMDQPIAALATFHAGSAGASVLFAGGGFTQLISGANSKPATGIAQFDGTDWSAVAGGMTGPFPYVEAFAVFDDGTGGGPALYVGGYFDGAGSVTSSGIAKWNGTTWASVGGGVDLEVRALAVFDDDSGGGPALYAGGQFGLAGGVPASCIAKWNGTSWSPLGSGVTGGSGIDALAAFDDGSGHGAALYAAGTFTAAGGAPANHVARWNGSSWSAVGSGMNGAVRALAAFNDGKGAGPKLFAGGDFTKALDTGDSYLATWASASPLWTDLGFALPGALGAPHLTGTGSLVAGTPGALALSHAAHTSLAELFIALGGSPLPFKGGVLVPLPIALTLPVVTSASGAITLPWAAWPAGLSTLTLAFQWLIADAGAVQGVALSNALRASIP